MKCGKDMSAYSWREGLDCAITVMRRAICQLARVRHWLPVEASSKVKLMLAS